MSLIIEAVESSAEIRGTVVLLHGFTRSPAALQDLSARCVVMGARTLRPALGSLWWPTSTNNAGHLTRIADQMLSLIGPGPVVVAGHSAGASAGAWIAAELVARGVDVTSLVCIDGVESPTHLIQRSWERLSAVPVRAVCAPPSRCNRQGALAAWLEAQDRAAEIVIVPGSGHGDIEGASQGIYRWACGDDPDQPAGQQVRDLVVRWIDEGLSPVPS